MNSILKFISKSLLFLLFLLVFYTIGVITYGEIIPVKYHQNILYKKFAYGFSNTRFKEVKYVDPVDILFLGSSRSYRHYDPRIFKKHGFSSFNLGTSSQTFLQMEILVDRYLDSLNPRYVKATLDKKLNK